MNHQNLTLSPSLSLASRGTPEHPASSRAGDSQSLPEHERYYGLLHGRGLCRDSGCSFPVPSPFHDIGNELIVFDPLLMMFIPLPFPGSRLIADITLMRRNVLLPYLLDIHFELHRTWIISFERFNHVLLYHNVVGQCPQACHIVTGIKQILLVHSEILPVEANVFLKNLYRSTGFYV